MGSDLTVLYFSAPWCGVCRAVEPAVRETVKQFPAVRFVKADIQETPQLGNEYHVTTLPTIVVKNGKGQKRLFGTQCKEVLEEAIRAMLD